MSRQWDTFPERIGHCAVCDFQFECSAHRRRVDDLSLVAGARRDQRVKLAAGGVTTVAALARAEHPYPVLHQQAALQVQSRATGQPAHRHLAPERARGYARLPAPSPGDVFFDLEGDPFVAPRPRARVPLGLVDVLGLRVSLGARRGGGTAALERFVDAVRELLARGPRHARLPLRAARAFDVAHRSSPATPRARRRSTIFCAARCSSTCTRSFARACRSARRAIRSRRLERHHGFERLETRVREGGGSIIAYETWLETARRGCLRRSAPTTRRTVARRCRCATGCWTRSGPRRRRQFAVRLRDVPSSPRRTRQPPDPAVAGRRRGARHRLSPGPRRGRPSAPAAPPAALTTDARASRPGGGTSTLRGKTPEELVEERDAIGGLVPDPRFQPGRGKRSPTGRCGFPPQEFRLEGDRAQDPTTGNRLTGPCASRTTALCSSAPSSQPAPEPPARWSTAARPAPKRSAMR